MDRTLFAGDIELQKRQRRAACTAAVKGVKQQGTTQSLTMNILVPESCAAAILCQILER